MPPPSCRRVKTSRQDDNFGREVTVLMHANELLIVIGLVLGIGAAIAGIFRPFLGLLVLVVIHYLQPGELITALRPFHIERVYSVCVIVAFLVYRAAHTGPSLLSNRVVIASFALVGVACLSIPFAVWRGGALAQTIVLMKHVVILVLVAGLVDTNGRLRKLLWIVAGLFIWFAASGMISFLHGEFSMQEGIQRAEGINSIAGSPNALAGLLLALMPFLAALFTTSKNFLIRCLLLVCVGLGVSTMVITGSRSCLLALIFVASYYFLKSKHRIPLMVLGACLFITLWVKMPDQYKERYLTVADYASGGQLDASNILRLRIWTAGLRMFLDHPILGVGAGQFPTAYGTTYAGRAHTAWMNPHDLFLQVACELGVVGLFAFGYFLTQLIRQIKSIPRAEPGSLLEFNSEVAVACWLMLLGVFIMSIVSHTLYRPYWYLLGGLVVANHVAAQSVLGAMAPGGSSDEAPSKDEGSRLDVQEYLVVNGNWRN
jgi:O-antigen ligase